MGKAQAIFWLSTLALLAAQLAKVRPSGFVDGH